MARSRNIKHGLYLNEELAELSIYARYLFPCLWCLADKNGRMEYRPRKIKAEAYPYDDVDIPGLLMELHEKQFISVYGHGTRAYIQVNHWTKHQNPHPKEKPSELPDINDELSTVASVGFNEDREKQFTFTAKHGEATESNGDAVKFNLIPDSNISDSLIPDINPSTTTLSKGQQAMLAMFEEKGERIRSLFPKHNYELVKEKCIANYESKTPPINPYESGLKWFEMEQVNKPAPKGKTKQEVNDDDREKAFLGAG